MTSSATAYQMPSADGAFEQTTIERRELGPHDVQIEIKYCGICHSDIHTARNEWRGTSYPVVPGHEIAGVVTAVFEDVHHLVSGKRGAQVYETGDTEAGIWWASTAQGLIDDIPSCGELVERMIGEAEEIIAGRLADLVGTDDRAAVS